MQNPMGGNPMGSGSGNMGGGSKKSSPVMIIIVIVILALIAWFVFGKKSTTPPVGVSGNQQTATAVPTCNQPTATLQATTYQGVCGLFVGAEQLSGSSGVSRGFYISDGTDLTGTNSGWYADQGAHVELWPSGVNGVTAFAPIDLWPLIDYSKASTTTGLTPAGKIAGVVPGKTYSVIVRNWCDADTAAAQLSKNYVDSPIFNYTVPTVVTGSFDPSKCGGALPSIPTVTISSPTANSTVSGTIKITATASVASTITILLDNSTTPLQTCTNATTCTATGVNTTKWTSGSHTIWAKATNVTGSKTTSILVKKL